ncbi:MULTISPECIES: hypothetical protein [unclassified Leifsonia]|uniref:hypothetical protein n=1 Tax=unclassified Leifsonia TaxID=2663824 RepID=UPI000361E098|nr:MULTISPECIES: hypothetical protein [unclassified Leifsonia]
MFAWLLPLAPLLTFALAFWNANREQTALRDLQRLSSSFGEWGKDDQELVDALHQARQDLAVEYLRRHRWKRSGIARTLVLLFWLALGSVILAIWQFTGWENDFLMWVGAASMLVGLGIALSRLAVKLLYKDDGVRYE